MKGRLKAALLLLGILVLTSAIAHDRDPGHGCTAPVRPADKEDVDVWNRFVDQVDQFRDCINRFVEQNHAASDRHRIVANAATADWNAFVRAELNLPEDFPHEKSVD